MSKIVRFHETGGPEVLKITDETIGEPGPNELRVRIQAIGLNRAEAMFRSGMYLEEPRTPAPIGYEAAAVVEALGEAVHGFEIGEPVCVIPAFSMNEYGVYAEQAIVPANAVVKRPPGLDAKTAAAVWMSYPTAWGALFDIANMTFGDTVLITAASSSVGLTAIQMANAVGATPVAITRTDAKAEALKQAGAAHVIASEQQDLVQEVMRITDNQGARIVFDPIGGPILESLAAATARFGTIFQYGALSTEPTPFPLFAVLGKGITVRGYTLFEFITNPAKLAQCVDFVNKGLADGQFKPVIAKTFTLDNIVEAHRYMESNEQFGKIIVEVPGQ
ncbi:NADPH:quinone reductase-like Zn-dependent oxidoreductase [Methylohalomonas lacus]|uniref:NADPH:quinone reductase-like Zn-dependent oxidoreductase n=1 Tax=Methylohalomonas lacus TaxID=398773 RepID=A0AAE3L1K9_9GAMM|nr:zinc-dependent alcohol dehydrogenase family protein [Methylohalomonas lacus]MCS3903296.1 NADPH:quinone reductase-like Zn-dependent oxidoreductase [Methylohalomonas lacus]